ncbi:MAG: protein of unknown function containing DUF4123 domain [Marinobacter excellens HL-55]|uniref:DUF4123 domain-containing protein n=1 Tax=Marinobacter excellens HL-55 TaxID=1305731 RepID=A0A0P8CZM3_9GAMM|nr:MAG: protein of unknown function containing DUF4123 domain [Marinobacter excellens HL-55]
MIGSEDSELRVNDGSVFDRKLQWFAILEGAHPNYDTRALIYRHISVPEWAPVYQAPEYSALVRVSPILLKLADPQDWHRTWTLLFPELSGSYLASEKNLECVAEHLQTMVSVGFEKGESIFRFHDSWIMSSLYPTLSESDRDRLHGPIEKWLWLRGNRFEESEDRSSISTEGYPLEAGWLTLDGEMQEAIYAGIVAKRTWKETQK